MENYKKYIFLGIIIISSGIVFSITLKDSIKSFGTVFIAAGCLFFIIGMSKKNKEK